MNRSFDMLSAGQRDAIVSDKLGRVLSSLGFQEINARTWVDGSTPPVRRMFVLQLLKGACLRAVWGFSLDFVPHISGGTLRWHRTNKTAMLDIHVDLPRAVEPCSLYGAKAFSAGLNDLIFQAMPKAEADWKRGDSVAGILTIAQRIRERNTNYFDFWNYTQLPLASVFLSARIGNIRDAKDMLEEYLIRRSESCGSSIADRLRSLVNKVEQI